MVTKSQVLLIVLQLVDYIRNGRNCHKSIRDKLKIKILSFCPIQIYRLPTQGNWDLFAFILASLGIMLYVRIKIKQYYQKKADSKAVLKEKIFGNFKDNLLPNFRGTELLKQACRLEMLILHRCNGINLHDLYHSDGGIQKMIGKNKHFSLK